MLTVTKILEGGVDLASGNPLPRCLVIGNGKDEVYLPIRDEDVREVLKLYADSGNGKKDQARAQAQQVLDLSRQYGYGALSSGAVRTDPALKLSALPDLPVAHAPQVVDDDYDPGEDYSDPDTGVRSV